MSEHAGARAPAWLRGNRNLILFLSLMFMIVLLPAFEHSPKGELLFAVVGMFITFMAVVVNGRSRLLSGSLSYWRDQCWIVSVLLAPFVHRMLHRFHAEERE